jgi:uncharacterized protein (UPF0218 family)
MLRLPEEARGRFKAPFGDLYPELEDALPRLRGHRVYAVGDVVTRNLIARDISPDIAIIDGHTMRIPCSHTPILLAPRMRVRNPPGTLTRELIEAIGRAVTRPPSLIIVSGEEDLAVIPLVLAAPEGGMVLYGQPGEGVVVREITGEAKRVAAEMFGLFEEDAE